MFCFEHPNEHLSTQVLKSFFDWPQTVSAFLKHWKDTIMVFFLISVFLFINKNYIRNYGTSIFPVKKIPSVGCFKL